jgi:hypothetical protein
MEKGREIKRKKWNKEREEKKGKEKTKNNINR